VIVVAAFVLVVASVLVFGGSLSRLGDLRVKHSWLIIVAFVVQFVVIEITPRVGEQIGSWAHLSSYAFAGAFLVANRHIDGLALVGVGGALNLAAIVANGGVMPASEWAVRTAGLSTVAGEFANSRALAHPRLQPLGDVFAIPRGWPFANVFSIGDIVLVVGAAVALHVICGSRLGSVASRRRVTRSGLTA
jgi:hypothetical protein